MNNSDLIVGMLGRRRRALGVRRAERAGAAPDRGAAEQLALEYVLTASETSAGFMASTVGALTGVPGVCVSTLGPGATNLATGVGAAWLDRAPVIAITCNVATPWLERRIQMRIDHHALFAPLTKATLCPARRLRRRAAGRGAAPGDARNRPGRCISTCRRTSARWTATESTCCPAGAGAAAGRCSTHDRRRRSKRAEQEPPAAAGHRPDVDAGPAAAARCSSSSSGRTCPSCSTLHAKGFLPESHPNYAGVLGRARRSDVQRFVDRADLIVAVGYDPIEINYEEWAGRHADRAPQQPRRRRPAKTCASLVNAAGDIDSAIDGAGGRSAEARQRLAATRDRSAPRSARRERCGPDRTASRPITCSTSCATPAGPDDVLAYDVGAHTHQIATQWRTDLPEHLHLDQRLVVAWATACPAAYAAKLVSPGARRSSASSATAASR